MPLFNVCYVVSIEFFIEEINESFIKRDKDDADSIKKKTLPSQILNSFKFKLLLKFQIHHLTNSRRILSTSN